MDARARLEQSAACEVVHRRAAQCFGQLHRPSYSRGRRNKAAIIWEGEPGDRRTLTYFDLYRQVSAFANVLKSLGVAKGDRVAIYMPLVPELAVAMLACARIGAPHSIVFGGFSAESLRDRMNDAQCKVLITADGGYRRGSIVPLRKVAFEALDGAASVTVPAERCRTLGMSLSIINLTVPWRPPKRSHAHG